MRMSLLSCCLPSCNNVIGDFEVSQSKKKASRLVAASSVAPTYLRQPDANTPSGAVMVQGGADWKWALDTLMAKNPAYNAAAPLDPENP